jgi:hypothetical protein
MSIYRHERIPPRMKKTSKYKMKFNQIINLIPTILNIVNLLLNYAVRTEMHINTEIKIYKCLKHANP